MQFCKEISTKWFTAGEIRYQKSKMLIFMMSPVSVIQQVKLLRLVGSIPQKNVILPTYHDEWSGENSPDDSLLPHSTACKNATVTFGIRPILAWCSRCQNHVISRMQFQLHHFAKFGSSGLFSLLSVYLPRHSFPSKTLLFRFWFLKTSSIETHSWQH